MTYNIHPILVHFPIALLFIYSIIKVLPFGKWFPSVAWKHVERALLFFGVLGAFGSEVSGELAEELARPNHQLVEMHSTFALLATILYSALLGGEIISVFRASYAKKLEPSVLKLAITIEKILCSSILSKIIALLGLIAISVTGLLGGVMVYGLSADPIAEVVLKLLGIQF